MTPFVLEMAQWTLEIVWSHVQKASRDPVEKQTEGKSACSRHCSLPETNQVTVNTHTENTMQDGQLLNSCPTTLIRK